MADSAKLTPGDVLEQLKKEGINSLEDLAKVTSERSADPQNLGAFVVHPHYLVYH